MGEKIDRSFPVGFNTLLLGYLRPSEMIEFQSVGVMVTTMFDQLTGYLFMFLLLVFMLRFSIFTYQLPWVVCHLF